MFVLSLQKHCTGVLPFSSGQLLPYLQVSPTLASRDTLLSTTLQKLHDRLLPQTVLLRDEKDLIAS